MVGPHCELRWSAGGSCLARIIRGSDLLQTGLHAPDLPGILGDGAVAGEFTRASYVMDHLLGPLFGVLVKQETDTLKNNMESLSTDVQKHLLVPTVFCEELNHCFKQQMKMVPPKIM